MASSHIRRRHKLHLRNYTPQFHNTESVSLIAFSVIGLPSFFFFSLGCLSFTGRDNERLALTICTEHSIRVYTALIIWTQICRHLTLLSSWKTTGRELLMTSCWWIMAFKCSAPWVHYTLHHFLLLKLHYSSAVDMKDLMNAITGSRKPPPAWRHTHTDTHTQEYQHVHPIMRCNLSYDEYWSFTFICGSAHRENMQMCWWEGGEAAAANSGDELALTQPRKGLICNFFYESELE